MDRHLEWLNANSERGYPLKVDTEQEKVPYNLFLDLSIIVPDTINNNLYISKFYRSLHILSLVIEDDLDNFVAIATCLINEDEVYQNLNIENINKTVTGSIIVGEGYKFLQMGMNVFSKDQTTLIPSTITTIEHNFAENFIVDTLEINKEVEFASGEGVIITADLISNSIMFKLTSPEQFLSECDEACNTNRCTPEAIYQINNVLPDPANGNITLSGDTVVVTSIEDNQIILQTPLLTPNDFCDNRTGPSPGPIGPIGPVGPVGPEGDVLCGAYDCNCQLCDIETGEIDCENIIMQCLQVDLL